VVYLSNNPEKGITVDKIDIKNMHYYNNALLYIYIYIHICTHYIDGT